MVLNSSFNFDFPVIRKWAEHTAIALIRRRSHWPSCFPVAASVLQLASNNGKTGENPAHVDWETRLKIAIGAARGIAAKHSQNGGKFVHGNIKATNIFLNSEKYSCVSDLGLTNMIETTFMPTARCCAPEVKNTRDVSQASDVYSFEILLLELLTRKSTSHVPGGPEAVDVVKLVNSVKIGEAC